MLDINEPLMSNFDYVRVKNAKSPFEIMMSYILESKNEILLSLKLRKFLSKLITVPLLMIISPLLMSKECPIELATLIKIEVISL